MAFLFPELMSEQQPPEDHENPVEELIDDPIDMPDRRVWLWLSIAVALLVTVGLGAPFAYKASKVWRARAFVAEAQKDFVAGNFTNGASRLRSAVILAPDDSDVLRMAAETLSLLESPEAISYWARLETKGDFTRNDRLNRVRIALSSGRLEIAAADLAKLYKDNHREPVVLALSVNLFQRMGNVPKAREAALELIAADPESRSSQLLAGDVLASDPAFQANRARGRSLLLGLALSPGDHQTNAWKTLGTLPDISKADLLKLVATLTNRPSPSLNHVMLAAEFARRADSNSIPSWLPVLHEAVRGNLATKTYGPELDFAAFWLLEHGDARWLLEQLPADESRRDARLLPIRLQALALTGGGAEIKSILGDTNSALKPFERALFEGLASWKAGDKTAADQHWKRALDEVGNRHQLRSLAKATSDAGAWSSAITAWKALLNSPSDRFDAAINLIQAARASRDARVQLDAYSQFLSAVPGDTGMRLEVLYLRLVLAERVEDTATEIEELAPHIRTTEIGQLLAAFAKLKRGNANEALATAERMALDWNKGEPRWKALYASLLAANGQREAARRLASTVPVRQLSTDERDCFGKWVAALR
jgi:uncharacterized protein HemY